MVFAARWMLGLVLFLLLLPRGFAQESAGAVPWVKRFPIEDGPLALRTAAREGGYFDALGRKAGVLGFERGPLEVWVYPFRILHGLRLGFQPEGAPEPLAGSDYAATATVRPEAVTITYTHPLFTVRQHIVTPLEQPGTLMLLDVDTSKPLIVVVSFFPDLKPMWPAGLGGQYTFWDAEEQAYVLSESRRKFNAVIGSPGATPLSRPPAHRLAATPNRFAVTVPPDTAARCFVPVAIAASVVNRDSARATYRRLLRNAERFYRQAAAHADSVHRHFTQVWTPDPALNRAFEWAKVALDDGLVQNPHLGRGLVAGYGPSGVGLRPGFAWFFGGDAFINSAAILAYGDFATVRQAIAFLQKRQRDDGKMMHELSQSAGLIRWFEEYPYGYIHGDTTPYYLVALEDYVRFSGDTLFLRQSWPSVLRAYRWCRSTDSDGDGLMENTLAGLGASELGTLREASGVDIFLAGIGIESWRAVAEMAALLGDEMVASEARQWVERGRQSLEAAFWNPQKKCYNFSITRDGNLNDEITAWAAFPGVYRLLPAEHARQALARLSSEEISTDWGARMLSKGSAAYDPLAYNNGAVWPFLTGYLIRAKYANERPASGFHNLRSLVAWTTHDALGYQPEVISGAYFRVLETSVPHQLFGSTAVVAGVLRGLLGWQADALRRQATLAPALPAEWDSLSAGPLWVGSDRVSVSLRRHKQNFELVADYQGDSPLRFRFEPVVGYGTQITEVRVNGAAHTDWKIESTEGLVRCRAELPLSPGRTVVEIFTRASVEVEWPWRDLEPGDRSQNLKPLATRYRDDRLVLEVSGRSGRSYDLFLRTERKVASVQGAELVNQSNGRVRLRLRFEGEGGYREAQVSVRFHAEE